MPTAAQPQFQILVANFSRPYPSLITGADPDNQSYTRTRTGFVFQHLQNLGFSTDLTNATGSPARSVVTSTTNGRLDPFGGTPPPTGSLEVTSDVFSGTSASLFVGPFELVSGRDFATGGGVNVTATALAAAIDALPGYSAAAVGAVVTVDGPTGQVGLRFSAKYRGGEQNFTFTYVAESGVLSQGIGDGPVEAPEILPAGVPNGVAP